MKELEKAAKNYADTMYRFEDRGVLYQETQNDFKAGANWLKSLLLEKTRSLQRSNDSRRVRTRGRLYQVYE